MKSITVKYEVFLLYFLSCNTSYLHKYMKKNILYWLVRTFYFLSQAKTQVFLYILTICVCIFFKYLSTINIEIECISKIYLSVCLWLLRVGGSVHVVEFPYYFVLGSQFTTRSSSQGVLRPVAVFQIRRKD